MDLNSAANAVKLFTHEIAGHGLEELHALSRNGPSSTEAEDHLHLVRPLDGSEGENIYLAAMRQVLPCLGVNGFPGLREEIIKEYPDLSRELPDSVFDNMLKSVYLHLCVNDIEQQVIDHLRNDSERDSDEPDPLVDKRCDELVEPMREAADHPDHPLWKTNIESFHDLIESIRQE